MMSACVFQEGVCGGLLALRVLRLGERAVLGLLLRLPEGVRGGDPVAVPALRADGHGGWQQQLQLGGDGEGALKICTCSNDVSNSSDLLQTVWTHLLSLQKLQTTSCSWSDLSLSDFFIFVNLFAGLE